MTRMRLALCLIGMFAVALLGATAQASPPEPFTISLDFYQTGPDTAAGEFEATGAIEDSGLGSETFHFSPPVLQPEDILRARTCHGEKELVGAEGDTIIIRFQGRVKNMGALIEGRFTILGGTGAYENLHGTGTFIAEAEPVELPDGTQTFNIVATYEGRAQYDNRRSSR
ncbi:hypothetical protein EH220_07970 [bacterium]|nr:MAG: hypothetical protein EH220_07970 [bacterium]